MRRKSPAAVQKWVDSIPIQQGTTSNNNNNNNNNQTQINNTIIDKPIVPTTSSSSSSNYQQTESIQNVEQSGSGIITTPTDDDCCGGGDDDDDEDDGNEMLNINLSGTDCDVEGFWMNKRKDELKNFGKLKINEFYDKLNLNKKRYNILKTKRTELKCRLNKMLGDDNGEAGGVVGEGGGISVNNDEEDMTAKILIQSSQTVIINQTRSDDDPHLMIDGDSYENVVGDDYDVDVDDDDEMNFYQRQPQQEQRSSQQQQQQQHLQILNQSDNNNLTSKRIGIGEIGRSASDNPPSPPSRLRSIKKKFLLSEIGRSFSENQNDSDIDVCGGIGIESSSCGISGSDYDQLNTLISSVPVSPVPRNQRLEIMSRDLSMTDRKNSLLRDNSVQVKQSQFHTVQYNQTHPIPFSSRF